MNRNRQGGDAKLLFLEEAKTVVIKFPIISDALKNGGKKLKKSYYEPKIDCFLFGKQDVCTLSGDDSFGGDIENWEVDQ